VAKTYPVYIPSKGRSENDTTKLCIRENIPFYLVVEPQDADDYISNHGKENCLVMPENNKGLPYARRFCKQHSIDQGHEWHWQIDDDIKGVMVRQDGKNIKTPVKPVICEIQNFIARYKNIGQAGLCHSLFAWSHSTDYGLNQQCPTFVIIRNEIPIWWRDGVAEDTDYSLQVLAANPPRDLLNNKREPWCTVLFYKYMFDTAVQGKLAGGNTDSEYADDGRLTRIKGLQKYWPGSFKAVWKHDSWRIAPSRVWQSFKQQLIKR
jgi:hypothetical protein